MPIFLTGCQRIEGPLSPKGICISYFYFLQMTIITTPFVVNKHFVVTEIAKIRNPQGFRMTLLK